MFSKLFEDAAKQEKEKKADATSEAAHHATSEASHHATDSCRKKKRRRGQKGKRQRDDTNNPKPTDTVEDTKNRSKYEAVKEMPTKDIPQKRLKTAGRQGPSEAALGLSAQLKDLSSKKCLNEALELYWDGSNDNIRDTHHACILIDCCARCGNILKGEEIVEELKRSKKQVSIETHTALLKGYAHSGMIHKADSLFRSISQSRDKRNRPNVRTLNTLLRGCLWTAATLKANSDLQYTLSGGVVTSKEAWSRVDKSIESSLDSSSYEYYIAQLCYALRLEEANQLVSEMKRRYGVPNIPNVTRQVAPDSSLDPTLLESLAISTAALARASAMLGKIELAKKNADETISLVEAARACASSEERPTSASLKGASGGKRAWRDPARGGASNPPRRSVSNSIFRGHRLSEVELEAHGILRICSGNASRLTPKTLARYLLTRVLYFSGGGTTVLSSKANEEVPDNVGFLRCQLGNALWYSFGLSELCRKIKPALHQGITILGENHCSWMHDLVGLDSGSSIISEDGYIDFQSVFRSSVDRSEISSRPLDIELGAGFGDWIVHQAQSNPNRNYVAVELRADRVAQTVTKAILNESGVPLENLCSVGADCGSFLRNRLRESSVSSIFVNHPEPPTQTYGSNEADLKSIAEGGAEPAHMLASDTLLLSLKCLTVDSTSRLVIVTDNRWYARLICATLLKVIRSNKNLHCCATPSLSQLRHVETFGSAGRDRVFMYEGQPCETIGHSVARHGSGGSSYFDRLWRAGAGIHAERRSRFIIVVERCEGAISAGGKSTGSWAPKEKSGKSKKNRKKSEEKQRRRNERRLAKKQGTASNG